MFYQLNRKMRSEELRNLQAPLKEKYRSHPESAMITLKAEGDLDFRGTLGISKEVPVGFRAIRLSFNLETEASEEQINTLIRLTERYCVVYQTLVSATEVNTKILKTGDS